MWVPQLWDGLVVCRSYCTWSDSRVIFSVSLGQQAQLVRIRQSFPDGRFSVKIHPESNPSRSIHRFIHTESFPDVSFFCENPSRIEYPDIVCQHISSSSVFMISRRSFRRRRSLAELSFSVGQHHSCWSEPGKVCCCVMKSGMIRVGWCLSSQPVEVRPAVSNIPSVLVLLSGPVGRSGLDRQILGVSLAERNFGLGHCLTKSEIPARQSRVRHIMIQSRRQFEVMQVVQSRIARRSSQSVISQSNSFGHTARNGLRPSVCSSRLGPVGVV